MHTSSQINPATSIIVFPIFFVALWCAIGFLTAKLSGWAVLAQRFRSSYPFAGQTWRWKSARMRLGANYNNCLTIGADPTGLYLSMIFFFRLGHPPLFLPWSEISVRSRRKILFIEFADFRLGREEQIPFLIRAKSADQVRAAAASSWPAQTA